MIEGETTITFRIHTFEIPSKRMKMLECELVDGKGRAVGFHFANGVDDDDYVVFQDEEQPDRRLICRCLEHMQADPSVWAFRICARGE
jgi:hypothetical protein